MHSNENSEVGVEIGVGIIMVDMCLLHKNGIMTLAIGILHKTLLNVWYNVGSIQSASMVVTGNNVGKVGNKIWDKYHFLCKFHSTSPLEIYTFLLPQSW